MTHPTKDWSRTLSEPVLRQENDNGMEQLSNE